MFVAYVDLPSRTMGEEVTLGHLGKDFMHRVHLALYLIEDCGSEMRART